MPSAREFRLDLEVLRRSLGLFWGTAPGLAGATVGVAVAEALIPAVGVWLLKRTIDAVAAGPHSSLLTHPASRFLGGFLLLVCLQQSLRAVSQFLQGHARDLLAGQVTLRVMESAGTRTDLAAFETPRFHDRLLLLQREVASRPMVLFNALGQGAQAGVTLLCMLALLARYHPVLVLVLAAAAAPGVFCQRRLYEAAWWGLSELLPLRRRLGAYARVLLTPPFAKEVRLFGFTDFILRRYLEQLAELMTRLRRARWRLVRVLLPLSLLTALGVGSAFAYVIDQALKGHLTLGDVSLTVMALYQASSAAAALTGAFAIAHEAVPFMRELFAFLDGEDGILRSEGNGPVLGSSLEPLGTSFLVRPSTEHRAPSTTPAGRPCYRLEAVTFRYPEAERPVLAGLNLEIPRGLTTAIVGENGAGKSTLVKLLLRLYDPTGGRILLDGVDLRDWEPERLRRQISVVFQDFARYPLTLAENIGIGQVERIRDPDAIRHAAQRAGVDALIERLPQGEQTLLGRELDGGVELSGGEWQRIALARAFIRDAPILILDEPTAALDPAAEADLYARFRQLAAGRTTLLISHRLATVRMADRILVLEAGRLIEEGDHSSLMVRGGRYAELYALQADRYRG